MNANRNLHLKSKEEQAELLRGEKVVYRKCNNCPHVVWHVLVDNIAYCGCHQYYIKYDADPRFICPCNWKIEGKLNRIEKEQQLVSNGHFSGQNGNCLGNSSGGTFAVQEDGNLVIYFNGNPKWASNTAGSGTAPFQLSLLNDGNLVLTDSTGLSLWKTKHDRKISQLPCHLIFQDDGNLVIYDAVNTPLWASHTDGQMHD
eukprot:NODE_946_length_2854_cov_0.150635.p1 type:complete len:201 gc:universal NODE_946_length_2854_cov_0.150635:983-381(-)